jgi:hypothetical protein
MGALVWLLPFIVAFAAFPLRQAARPLFESIMAVAVTSSAVLFGLAYTRGGEPSVLRDGVMLGLLWFAISVLIDAPLMLLGGPMHMSLGAYMQDIGVTYIIIPVVTSGLAIAGSRDTGGRPNARAA